MINVKMIIFNFSMKTFKQVLQQPLLDCSRRFRESGTYYDEMECAGNEFDLDNEKGWNECAGNDFNLDENLTWTKKEEI